MELKHNGIAGKNGSGARPKPFANKAGMPEPKTGAARAIDQNEHPKSNLFAFGLTMKEFTSFIANGGDVNERDAFGQTPLMHAIHQYNFPVAEAMIAAGADVNAVDTRGNTALMWAVYRGPVSLVKSLIAAGADVNARDYEGRTVLQRVRGYFAGFYDEVVPILREAGAKG